MTTKGTPRICHAGRSAMSMNRRGLFTRDIHEYRFVGVFTRLAYDSWIMRLCIIVTADLAARRRNEIYRGRPRTTTSHASHSPTDLFAPGPKGEPSQRFK